MGLNRYDTLFEDYLQNIALTMTQSRLIDDALEDAVSLFMTEYEGSVDIYTQGSYAMGTIVRPLTEYQSRDGKAGEYDIDIVLERGAWAGAAGSLQSVRNVLSSEYGDKVDAKMREHCERVLHRELPTGVIFHADYVPVRYTLADGRRVAARTFDVWRRSDTKKLVEWFKENYASNFTFLPALIVILKRIRDYAGLTDDLPSLCITAMVCNNYTDTGSYAGDLLFMLGKIKTIFSVPEDQLSIKVEPLGDENIAGKVNSHKKILDCISDCLNALRVAFADSVQDMSTVADYLSNDFPTDLAKYPEFLEPLRHRGFGIELDGSLNMHGELKETYGKGRLLAKFRVKFFGAGEQLLFKANQEYDPKLFSARWQVLNSPQSERRRGNLFYAKNGSEQRASNAFTNHETESYDGEHWIRCFIYNIASKKVVEVATKYYVEVEK